MKGFIDGFGRALLSIRVHSVIDEQTEDVNVWIDTGFTGEFVLPRDVIEALHLPTSGSVDAVLADGSAIELNTFTCLIEWFGEKKRIEVVESEVIAHCWAWDFSWDWNCERITAQCR